MKDQLAKALELDEGEGHHAPSDRILQASFFRRAPLQAGTQPVFGIAPAPKGARVIPLGERRRGTTTR